MNTKFVIVKEVPKELPKHTCVIESPDFLEQVVENKGREPRGGVTAGTHLRYIVGSIGEKYDPELGAYTVRPNLYEGRAYANDKELAGIVVEMLKSQYPKVFNSYLDNKIKTRPSDTKVIFFVGNFADTTAFSLNGIDSLDEKDVDVHLGLKEKKVVGKPAVKDKQPETDDQDETKNDKE